MEIQTNSPNECWYRAMHYLLKHGKEGVMYQRDCVWIDNITYVLKKMVKDEMPPHSLLNQLFFRDYPTRYKYENGEDNANQFELALEVLEHGDSISRAMIVTASPNEDAGLDGSPKCLTYIHFYLESEIEETVSCICSYSVSNMAQFNLLDIYLLNNIHKEMATRLGKKVGKLIIHFDRIFLWKPDEIIYNRLLFGGNK